MEAKLQEAIKKLPAIQKAHIYEPKIEDVAEISFKAGIREVIEWMESNASKVLAKSGLFQVVVLTTDYQAKLKEWGIEGG